MDTTNVTITFSEWDITRISSQQTALSLPTDGCSITSLSAKTGLDAGEFKDWLTVDPNQEVLLFNGETKRAEDLCASDVLAASTEVIFRVPNTIYAAYCFNTQVGNSVFYWNQNIRNLRGLGFNVITFVNALYTDSPNDPNMAKRIVMGQSESGPLDCGISYLSKSKALHGIWIVSHGSPEGFGVGTWTNQSDWGRPWSLRYCNDNFSLGNDLGQINIDQWSILDALQYHLGAFICQACYGEAKGVYLVDQGGDSEQRRNIILKTISGELPIAAQDIAMYWKTVSVPGVGTYYGNCQGVNYFPKN